MVAQVHSIIKQTKQAKVNQIGMNCITHKKYLGSSQNKWKINKTTRSQELIRFLTCVEGCGQEATQAINNYPLVSPKNRHAIKAHKDTIIMYQIDNKIPQIHTQALSI